MNKKIILIIVGVIVALLIVGFGLRTIVVGMTAELTKEVAAKNEEIADLETDYADLRTQMSETTVTEESLKNSLQILDGKTVPEFVFIEDKIVFPNPISLPNSVTDIGNSYIQVGSKFKFTPSDSWNTIMKGTELNLYHPTGIYGSIKGVMVGESIRDAELLKAEVQKFFVGFPTTNITYTKLYIDDAVAGMLGQADIEVEGKPYVVVTGLINRSETGLLFMFLYEKQEYNVQSELVNLLIKSGVYNDSLIKME